jgi:Sec-independent protein translocase protein TatA
MGLIDPTHLLLVALIALIVVGPRRLQGLGQALVRAAQEMRDAMGEPDRSAGDGGAHDARGSHGR